jgi:hypothetical protein
MRQTWHPSRPITPGSGKKGETCPVPGCTAAMRRENQHLCYAHWQMIQPRLRTQLTIAWHRGEPDEFFDIALAQAIKEATPCE